MGFAAGKDVRWKETAWNGIRFAAPGAWELNKIGRRYLVLEEEDGPVLEVKWGPIKGSFSHRKHLRRLSALYGKQSGIKVKESPLPKGWGAALRGYEASGFAWSGKTLGGRGVVLFCPTCRNATLIQFYQKKRDIPECISRHLLTSFQDHRQDDRVVWSVFDIRAVIPGMFRLVGYCFEPGKFELSLASKGQTITLYRWGPAAVLLSDRNLEQFANAMVRLPKQATLLQAMEERDALEWEATPRSFPWSRWRRRLKGKADLQWFRIWHENEKNRILGVGFQGKRPADPVFLEKIVAGYETL